MSLPTTPVTVDDLTSIIQKLLAISVQQVDGVLGANYASSHPDVLMAVFQAMESAYFQSVNLAQRQLERDAPKP